MKLQNIEREDVEPYLDYLLGNSSGLGIALLLIGAIYGSTLLVFGGMVAIVGTFAMFQSGRRHNQRTTD